MIGTGDIQAFEAQRPRLTRLAYRMLGSVAEAEDAVQDAWLRWTKAEGVEDPAGWLVRVTSRLCIDRMRSEYWAAFGPTDRKTRAPAACIASIWWTNSTGRPSCSASSARMPSGSAG